MMAPPNITLAAWPTSWQPPGADRLSLSKARVNSRIWLPAVDDSTINIVPCIIIVIIISHIQGGRLPLHSFGPAVPFWLRSITDHWPVSTSTAWRQRHI